MVYFYGRLAYQSRTKYMRVFLLFTSPPRVFSPCKNRGQQLKIAGVLELADKQASDTCVFNMRVQVPSPAPKKSYHFDTTFFIQAAGLVYHHALACISSALWAVYHHPSECIFLRFDEILARKRDILVFGRMIYTFCESDLICKPFLFLTVKYKSFNLYPYRSIDELPKKRLAFS